ncbi:hypothetical protein LCGC14_2823490, partial [marine sediment metagenome]
LRYQEYYEGVKFYKKIFTLVDYMEWYSKTQCARKDKKNRPCHMFSYTDDWSGFNIPGWALKEVLPNVPDWNKYDDFMSTIFKMIKETEGDHSFYLIGTYAGGATEADPSGETILDHEVAHALFYTNRDYRIEVCRFLGGMKRAEDALKAMGYHETTIKDEVHAYCATGLCDELKEVISKQEMKPFQKLFKEYKKKCAAPKS